ncbi:MAG: hypothetical protein HC819_19355 [Cyclobacteriaceae bacterium]|nr:hypothetical protein [Cyclobacteriaceae bacterium]
MEKTHPIQHTLLFLLFILLLSCREDEVKPGEDMELPSLPQFSFQNFDDPILKNLSIDWDDVKIVKSHPSARTDSSEVLLSEYSTDLSGRLTLDDSLGSKEISFKLLEQKSSDTSEYFLLKLIPDNDSIDMSKVSYLDLGGFSGTVHVFKETGELYAVQGYINGVMEAWLQTIEPQDEAAGRAAFVPSVGCPWSDYSCSTGGGGAGSFVTYRIDRYTDWFVNERYVGSDHEWTRYHTVFVPTGTTRADQHEHYEAPHAGASHGSAHLMEIIKDASFKNTKAECVYDKLVKTNTLKRYVQKFDAKFPVAHLKFELSSSLSSTTNGQTRHTPGSLLINIALNANTLSGRTTMEVARTIFHEIIHAEMYRIVIENNYSVSINDYPGVYDYYSRYKFNAQHQQMAAHYIDIIGQALKEFDGAVQSDQYYDDIAWDGLMGNYDAAGNLVTTIAWNQLSQTDKNRILGNISNHK